MPSFTVALDVDGTLTSADPEVLIKLREEVYNLGGTFHINTARSTEYCISPSPLTLSFSPKEDHHCMDRRRNSSSVTATKAENMSHIQASAGVERRECVILVDDLPSNVDAVVSEGYSGVRVHPTSGVTEETLMSVLDRGRRCNHLTSSASSS